MSELSSLLIDLATKTSYYVKLKYANRLTETVISLFKSMNYNYFIHWRLLHMPYKIKQAS